MQMKDKRAGFMATAAAALYLISPGATAAQTPSYSSGQAQSAAEETQKPYDGNQDIVRRKEVKPVVPGKLPYWKAAANFGVGSSNNAGFKNPSFAFGGTATYRYNHFGLEASSEIDTANKLDSGAGWTARASGAGRVFVKDVFLEGGVSSVHLNAKLYTKGATTPYAGVGYQGKDFAVWGDYFFEESQTPNHVRGAKFGIRQDLFPRNRRVGMRSEIRVTVFKFRDGLNRTLTADELSAYFGIVWRNRNSVE